MVMLRAAGAQKLTLSAFIAFARQNRYSSARHPADTANDDGADPFRELDCLRGNVNQRLLAEAEHRAARTGVGADQALIAAGALSGDDYLRRLSRTHGLRFETLESLPRALCPLDDDALIAAARTGMMTVIEDDVARLVIAPRGLAVRRLLSLLSQNPAFKPLVRFTSHENFIRFVLRAAGTSLGERAALQLHRQAPHFSAAPPHRFKGKLMPGAVAALIVVMVLAPLAMLIALQVALALVFAAWTGLRLTAAAKSAWPAPIQTREPDSALPGYTVIAALYHEARSVDRLLRAIERLDYPGIR